DQSLICLQSLRRKARDLTAEVGLVKRGAVVNLSRQEALAQRAVWNEADAEFLERRQDILFRAAPPQRVFTLHCGDRLDGVRAANRLRGCLGKAELPDLACLNQVPYSSGDVFNRNVRVNAVLVEQIDGINLEALERSLCDPLDLFWPAVEACQTSLRLGIDFPSELGGDHHLPTERFERFAHQFFVDVRA